MINPDFDPYDALINMNERLLLMEKTHNALAHAYELTAEDLRQLKIKHINLEKSHLALANHVFSKQLEQLAKNN